ncbi:MAG: thioesterase family protein [Acidimicrobiales bacterium]
MNSDMAAPWLDLDVTRGEQPGTFTTRISSDWQLVVVPQGGIVAAIAARAMELELNRPDQLLRTMTSVFAGQVAVGPVEISVEILRRGRSMSQCIATVRNSGAEAGLTAVAVFGAERKGFSFVDAVPPDVPDPESLRSFRDPLPAGVEFEFTRPPVPFWERIVDGRSALGRAPWEAFEDGRAESASWFRIDEPPTSLGGALDRVAPIVLCDMMPSAVFQKVGPSGDTWFGPSADYTIHLFGEAEPGWLLGHTRARWAGDGYASVEMTLWDQDLIDPIAYATQIMFFAFGR